MLNIDNLHAEIDGKPILTGLSLTVKAGEMHAIMGPNGAGKSTLGYVLAGRPGYEVTGGSVSFTPNSHPGDEEGADLLSLAPHERAAAGLFLGFQYPVEIPGVSNLQFLREALNAQRKGRGEAPLSGAEFLKLARAQATTLGLDPELLKRPVNVGFSGGEKKRAEMVQMGIIGPRLAILDETDSGLDIDALKAVGAGINTIMRRAGQGGAAHHPLPAPARLCGARLRSRARRRPHRPLGRAGARAPAGSARAMRSWRREAHSSGSPRPSCNGGPPLPSR